jgi:hypothetical protein
MSKPKPLKTVFAPHLNSTVKFGRVAPKRKSKALFMRDYLDMKALPPITLPFDFTKAAMPSLRNIFKNNVWGCCVISGGYHLVGTETGNATGSPFVATDDDIYDDYHAIGGFNKNDPSSDQGCNEDEALSWWEENGFRNGTKPIGHLQVDPSNWNEVVASCFLFENLVFGMSLPDEWISPFPSGDGFVWDVSGDANPENGHCVVSPAAATADGVVIDSWALLGLITKKAIAKYCSARNGGQLFVVLTPDQIAKAQAKAPNGFAWADLLADWNQLGGNVVVPPAPAPTPAPPAPSPEPTPAPAPSSTGPTLAVAQAAVKAALDKEKAVLSRTEASRVAKAALAKLPGWPQ